MSDGFKPQPLDTEGTGGEVLPCTIPWLTHQLVDGGIREGERALIYGEQGVGKSSITSQIALGFAEAGCQTLTLVSELDRSEVSARVLTIAEGENAAIAANLRIAEVGNLDQFEEAVSMIAQGLGGFHPQVVILDSLQGLGLNSSQSKSWGHLYALLRALKETGIATLLIGHCIKNFQPAGPKSLEHEVDLIIRIRKLGTRRLVYVPKNRHGQAHYAPVIFKADEIGRLVPDPKATTVMVAKTWGFDGGGLVAVEAKIDHRGNVTEATPPILSGLKRRHYDKLASILAYHQIDLSEFTQHICANIPGDRPRYSPYLDLALAMALASSFGQRPLSPWQVFIGELSLDGEIVDRPNPGLARALAIEMERAKRDNRRLQVFLPLSLGVDIHERIGIDPRLMLCPVFSLKDVGESVWPSIGAPI